MGVAQNQFKAQTGTGRYLYYNIFFTNDRFFALGTGKHIASSIDGVSWDSINVGPTITRKISIVYGSAGYVLAEMDTIGDSTFIWTSENGNNWIKRHGIEGYSFKAAYGNGQYVISGYSGGGTPGNAWTLTSSDATTWSKNNPDSTILCFTDVIYADQKFVAVGATLSDSIGFTMISSDGSNWTNMTPEAERLPSELWAVAFGNNRFVTLGQHGGNIISTDGILWSKGDTSLKNSFHSIAYGNGYFVGIGEHRFFYSTNGVNWTTSDTIRTIRSLFQIAYGNNQFVVTTGGSDSVLISQPFNEPLHRADFSDISYSPVKVHIINDALCLTFPLSVTGKPPILTCHDATGRKIFNTQLAPSNTMITYDIKHLSPGWYVLSLNGKYGLIHKSFVINR